VGFHQIFSTLSTYFKNITNDDAFNNAKNAYEQLTDFVKSFNYAGKDIYDENEWRFIAKDEKNGKPIGDFVLKNWIRNGRSAVSVLIIPKKYKSKLIKEVRKMAHVKKAKIMATEDFLNIW